MSRRPEQKIGFVVLLFLAITLIESFTLTPYSGFASPKNNDTLIEPESSQGIAITNATTITTNIVLVHGAWADGSSWRKLIPILQNAGHRVIAVQLPLHSVADDIATVKRAVDLVGGPTILVGHSYGGFVITNAAYNNSNVTGLVYLTAFVPDEGESLADFVPPESFPPGFLIFDSGGFSYINPDLFAQGFARGANSTEAGIMAATQK